MASAPGGEAASPDILRLRLPQLGDGDSSESGSSYIGSDVPSPGQNACPWRTGEFQDQECARYFDCPTHRIERMLSDRESESSSEDEDEGVSGHGIEGDARGGGTAGETLSQASTSDSDGPPDPRDVSTAASQSPSPDLGEVPGYNQRLHEERFSSPTDITREGSGASGTSGPRTISEGAAASANLPSASVLTSFPTQSPTTPPAEAGPSIFVAPPRSPAIRSPLRPPLQARARGGGSLQELPSLPARPGSLELVLPRWQPDAEVTYCPICHAQFSIFVRKHHCRKCGRVVCNSCSPHRITIPHQYIVRPPGQARLSQRYQSPIFMGSQESTEDFSTLGGGERVRLCNPCVPDPNITPPQPQASPNQFAHRAHNRSQSSAGGQNPNRYGTYFPTSPPGDGYTRSRSVTMNLGGASTSRPQYTSTEGRILAGTPPVYYPASSRPGHFHDARGAASSSSSQRPLPPPPQVAEEDECPVCHRELPARNLPNFEALREAHINICITAHSTYSGGPASVSPDGSGTPPPLTARRTGMFPYAATEKDCVDSAECTICLEEFEVGVPMARLECLCRFHRACISAWFVNHPGRCPVHQHDSFGY